MNKVINGFQQSHVEGKTIGRANLKSTILNKFSAINGDSNTLIYVVGTLTGGTGSGLSVDIAYLLQEILPQCANNIQALFLLPDEASFSKNKSLHENTFSALASIDHYTTIGNDFTIKWPDGTPEKTFTSPPYQMVQLLSQNFSNGNAPIVTLDQSDGYSDQTKCLWKVFRAIN